MKNVCRFNVGIWHGKPLSAKFIGYFLISFVVIFFWFSFYIFIIFAQVRRYFIWVIRRIYFNCHHYYKKIYELWSNTKWREYAKNLGKLHFQTIGGLRTKIHNIENKVSVLNAKILNLFPKWAGTYAINLVIKLSECPILNHQIQSLSFSV
jgi:hypothetical protein